MKTMIARTAYAAGGYKMREENGHKANVHKLKEIGKVVFDPVHPPFTELSLHYLNKLTSGVSIWEIT